MTMLRVEGMGSIINDVGGIISWDIAEIFLSDAESETLSHKTCCDTDGAMYSLANNAFFSRCLHNGNRNVSRQEVDQHDCHLFVSIRVINNSIC